MTFSRSASCCVCVRFMVFVAIGSNSATIPALQSSNSRLLALGVGWMAPLWSLGTTWPQGWLSFRPAINTSQPLYAAMAQGFNKYWLEDFKRGYNLVNASSPTAASSQAFNAMMAMANSLDKMFLRMKPPVYTTSQACGR